MDPVLLSGHGKWLSAGGLHLLFIKVDLVFTESKSDRPVWALKNNKTIRETLQHHRYAALSSACDLFKEDLDKPLGEFLFSLKERGNPLYTRFLNPDGDADFVTFSITDRQVLESSGLYLFLLQDEVVYVGRCLDCFGKRINQGYGKIHPKNCYIDGQRTNCRLNSLIAEHREEIGLYLRLLEDASQTTQLESELIRTYRPKWNKHI
jgi:hypothetical protein